MGGLNDFVQVQGRDHLGNKSRRVTFGKPIL